jgi:hypothetical protein
MSDADINRVIGRITKKLFYIFIPTLLLIIGLQVKSSFSVEHKADRLEVEGQYSALYTLIAEQTQLLKTYIEANDREKDQIWEQIQHNAERLDRSFESNEVRRGTYTKKYSSL